MVLSPLNITITKDLRLNHTPAELMRILMENLTFTNPKWLENERMGRWNRGTPRELRFYDRIARDRIWIPRGYIRRLILCVCPTL